jgi:hypothetical protein
VTQRVAALMAAAALMGGCGGANHKAPPAPRVPDATVQQADCNQWRELRARSRLALLANLRAVFGGPVDPAHGHGQVLGDQAAGRLLDRACRPPYAGRFKLYKIYGRAAAFTPGG